MVLILLVPVFLDTDWLTLCVYKMKMACSGVEAPSREGLFVLLGVIFLGTSLTYTQSTYTCWCSQSFWISVVRKSMFIFTIGSKLIGLTKMISCLK